MKLASPLKYKHTIFAFPQVESNPFPVEALAYEKNPLGMILTPATESESSKLVLNPIFGNSHPLFLQGEGHEFAAPTTIKGWHFVPFTQTLDLLVDRSDASMIEKSHIRLQYPRPEKGIKTPGSKYLHYAKVYVPHTFPIDMLRYDRAAPLAQVDAQTILDIATNRQGGTVYVVKASDSSKPNWWPDRWHSFGGTKFQEIRFNDLPDERKYA